jgi:competence protein ComEA
LDEVEYIYIDIKGAVLNPGVYKFESNTRLFQAIYKAGGLLVSADENAINLSLLLNDQQVVYIPTIDDEYPSVAVIEEEQNNGLVDINTANMTELETLPGVGPANAQSIIDYREEYGVFSNIEDIMNVKGIGESTYNELKNLITV